MNDNPSLPKETAEKIVPLLMQASGLMSEAVAIVQEECSPRFTEEFKVKMANAMTALGWDVLEQMVYEKFPALRPYDIDNQQEGR